MYQALVLMSLFGPIFVTGQFTCSDQDWLLFGTSCYKIGDTLDYLAATTACSNLSGFIIMPKTTEEMKSAISLQNSLPRKSGVPIPEVWIGFNKINSNGNWKWADGSELNKLNVTASSNIGEDCVRLVPDTKVKDCECNRQCVTVCQRAASLETTSNIDITSSQEIPTTNRKTTEGPTTTEADILETTSIIDITSSQDITTTNQKPSEAPTTATADMFGTTSPHLSTKTETFVETPTSYIRQLEITSIMDISSSPEVTTETPITVEVSTTTDTDLSVTTVAELSTNTETTVELSTSNSASSVSRSPTVSSTPSSVMSTNSTQYCTYVSICSNQTNNTSGSREYTYKVDKKKLSSYKRKHQSASDPRKSSMYIGSVGIAVLVSVVLLIVFLDCVPTKV